MSLYWIALSVGNCSPWNNNNNNSLFIKTALQNNTELHGIIIV